MSPELEVSEPDIENHSGLLPFDFARNQQVLFNPGSRELIVGPDASSNALAEVRRVAGQIKTTHLVDQEEFVNTLRKLYAEQRGSSAAVMEDIKDFVDLESAAEELEEADLL